MITTGSTRLPTRLVTTLLFGTLTLALNGPVWATEPTAQGGSFTLDGAAFIQASAGGPFRLRGDVIAAGAQSSSAGGTLRLDQVIAEPVVGAQRGVGFVLAGGFLAAPNRSAETLFADGFESR